MFAQEVEAFRATLQWLPFLAILIFFLGFIICKAVFGGEREKSMETLLGLTHTSQGPKHLCYHPVFSQSYEREVGLEVQQVRHQPVFAWDPGITGDGLTHCTMIPILRRSFIADLSSILQVFNNIPGLS